MALQKDTVAINFSKGIDTKTDALQLPIGNFTSLKNGIFDKLGLLMKRPGNAAITALPSTASFLTTFKDNLTAIGSTVQAYATGTDSWISSGSLQPLQLSTMPLIRNSVNQNQCDTAISANNLVCTVYSETNGSTTSHKYAIADVTTGQNLVAPTALAADATFGQPRVFYLGTYFVIVYINHPAAYNLKYISVNSINLVASAAATLSTSITPASTVAFDGAVYNGALYVAWNGSTASGIKAVKLSDQLVLSSSVNPDAAHVATMVSVCADTSNSNIWISYYDSGTTNGYTLALSSVSLATTVAATAIMSGAYLNITSAAQNGVNTVFYETSNTYSYDGAIKTPYVGYRTCNSSGVTGVATASLRSVGLASKAFIVSGVIYYLGVYSSPYQPTYFLVNGTSSLQAAPVIVAKLAYTNGGGFLTIGLPSVTVTGTVASVSYLFKDLFQAENKNTNVASGNQTVGVYTQTGINLANFDFTSDNLSVAELGNNLQISGGFLSMYDGYKTVEQNFFLYPDYVEVTTSTTGGNLKDQDYYYQALYSWSDNQGNIHRSGVSIPVKQTTSGGNTSTNTINVPTLRATMKTANSVKIELYRWSTAQQVYYQVTSLTVPTLNDLTADSVAITDTLSDATILGNSIIYTNGGVIENENSPSPTNMSIFDTRLWMIDGENQNLLRYSKQVIEATPVEMSSLLTFYVSPTASVQHSTGPIRCIFPMDDKLIIFKDSSIYYINGTGPDNTGANGQYSEPIFVTSSVGCNNPSSLVMTPNGIMFQSQNGIWILNRGLGTQYIGAPMEAYNSDTVLSAVALPGTNRVQFDLDTGVTLMYDHFVGQWGTFVGIKSISSTIYQGLHTYMAAPVSVAPAGAAAYTLAAEVFQQTPGLYLDGSRPVLMQFTTGWLSLAGIQGYQRAYWFDILGTYISPHTLGIGIAYDYDSSIAQYAGITPDNYSPPWGGDPTWGDSPLWGGGTDREQWEICFQNQKCQAFQISLQEYFDASIGAQAGAGLTISSLNLVVGLKKRYTRNIPVSHSTG